MARNKGEKKLNPRQHALKEQKKMKRLMISFIITGVVIVGIIAAGLIYRYFIQDNIPVATVDGERIDNEYFKARVRLERNGYLQQYLLLNAQAQIYASDPNQVGYFQDQMMQIASALDNVALFGEVVLENIIEEEIIMIKGEEMGLEVTDAEVDALFQRIFNYYPEGTPTPEPTMKPVETPTVSPTQEAILQLEPTTIVDALKIEADGGIDALGGEEAQATEAVPTGTPAPTATPFTEEMFQSQFDDYIADLEEINVSEKHMRTYLSRYLMREKVLKALGESIPAEQEQVWARHILVPTESEAQEVLARLENGEKWAEVAADVSLDTSNKDRGGDLGWFSAGQMVAPFNDAAFGLEIGEISDPVETQFGWHIIQLVNKEVLPLSFSDLQSKQNLAFQEWLAEAKEGIPYEINDVYRDITPSDPSLAELIASQNEFAAEESAEESSEETGEEPQE